MDFSNILDNRRAINFFDPDKDVEQPLLEQVIKDAGRAPSSFNLQPWNLIVLRDMERKQKLRPLAWDQPKITEAPVVLIVLGDREGWKERNETFELVYKDFLDSGKFTPDQRDWFLNATKSLYGYSDAASQAFANKNAGLYAMSLMYAASNHGLQTHPMDGFDHEGVRKAFNIPDRYWIPMLIAVGYLLPGVTVHPQRWRKSWDQTVVDFD